MFRVLEVFSELTNTGYDPSSLALSTRQAYSIRNMYSVHEGQTLKSGDARRREIYKLPFDCMATNNDSCH